MKAFLAACVAMAVITFGSAYGLGQAGFSAAERTSGAAVRLD